MILYFDTYVVSLKSQKEALKKGDRRTSLDKIIRFSDSIYRLQSKVDIVKYTLLSYSYINWEEVYIKYECEEESDSIELNNYIKNLFPNAEIENKRSSTSKSFLINLLNIKNSYPDSLIFFSPNNDHPFYGSQPKLNLENNYLRLKAKYKNAIVSIAYSHQYEYLNSVSPKKSLWGRYSEIFPVVVYEDDEVIAVNNNKFLCDSVQVFHIDDLITIFKDDDNEPEKRVTRLEDTKSYLSQNIENILIIPKKIMCQHFDGYYHIKYLNFDNNNLLPLFIPNGIFNGDLIIKYGFDQFESGYTNINPNYEGVSFKSKLLPDALYQYDDIPYMWIKNSKEIIKLESFNVENNKKTHKIISFINLNKSAFRYSIYLFKKLIKKIYKI